MIDWVKKYTAKPTVLAVVMIVLTALLTHGLGIARLGYYYDDWYMLWSGASRGADSLIGLFSMDRPFMGVIYTGFYRLLLENAWAWHTAALLMRTAGGLAFYWIMTMAWPRLKRLNVLIAMLFIVFPGFLAQPNAATKINHLTGYAAALFSIACTLRASQTTRRAPKLAFTTLSLLLMALYLWIYEYMIGLEVLRIALYAWMQWPGQGQRWQTWLKKAWQTYLPHLVVIALFLYWRVFVFESTRSATDLRGLVSDYRADVFSMALRLVFQVIKDFFNTSLFAWFVQAYHLMTAADSAALLRAGLAGLLMALLVVAYIRLTRGHASSQAELVHDRSAQLHGRKAVAARALLIIGAVSALAAVFPVVLSNRHIDLMDPYKGYALHPSAGVMMMVLGLVLLLKPKFRVTTLLVLLIFSASVQSLNTQRWVRFWEVQRTFWWQLTWRAPDIADNTVVMAYLPEGYVFQQDYEIWGPLNLIYRDEPLSTPRIQSEVLNNGTLLDVQTGQVTDPWVRDIFMGRDFRRFLLISQPTTQSCLHVIDGALPAYSTNERLIVEKVGAFSNPAFIDVSATPPLPRAALFGREPDHGWCYDYQQASLARQRGDWQRIVALYEHTQAQGLRAGDSSENFVFMEGLVNLGRIDEASALAEETLSENTALAYELCQQVSALPPYPADYGYRQDAIHTLVCGQQTP